MNNLQEEEDEYGDEYDEDDEENFYAYDNKY
jgi:hypothetical protein